MIKEALQQLIENIRNNFIDDPAENCTILLAGFGAGWLSHVLLGFLRA